MLRPYLILIFMADGSHGRLRGLFPTDWAAIDAATSAFYDARAIVPRRLA